MVPQRTNNTTEHMSRSNPVENNPHPCQMWLEWKGGPGQLSYWDKNKGDNGERVMLDVVKKPMAFIYLDQTSTAKGYSKPLKVGLYANEVRDTRVEPLTVRFHGNKQVVASGLWNDIKDTVTSKRNGGGFAKNVYVAYKDGGALKVGCIQMSGCSLGPWFEFFDKHRKEIESKGVRITAGEKDDSGGVEFIPPSFSICEISPESDMAAKKLDVELQAFLKDYFARTAAPAPKAGEQPKSAPEPGDDGPPVDDAAADAAAQDNPPEPPF